MQHESESSGQNELRIYVIGGILIAIGAAVGLYLKFAPPASKSDPFDHAVFYVEGFELDKAREAMESLGDSEQGKLQRELIGVGVLLRESKPELAQQRLAEIDPDNSAFTKRGRAMYYVYASRAYYMLGENEKAWQQAQLASEVDRSDPVVQRQGGFMYMITREGREHIYFIREFKPVVDAFCGDCHVTPPPSSYPVDKWEKEVDNGYMFHEKFQRTDLQPPPKSDVLKWYQMQAPEELPIYDIMDRKFEEMSTEAFELVTPGPRASSKSATSFIDHVRLFKGKPPVLLGCNIMHGEVRAWDPLHLDQESQLLGKVAHAGHAEVCDLDQDGINDVLVAELGSFEPSDELFGKVVCLHGQADGTFEPHVLIENIGRVADVRSADVDADGDLDLIVAEFGWRTAGRILLLENKSGGGTADGGAADGGAADSGDSDDESADDSAAEAEVAGDSLFDFEMRMIDPRHGTIHVPVIDINADGHPDFIALISQAHESVVAFVNDGKGNFKAVTLFAASEPSYGVSGLTLSDIDGDDDMDVLFTNGDMFDGGLMRPNHGVQWLENKGDLDFELHSIMSLFGAYSASAADFDNDGDQDIVVVASLQVQKLEKEFVKVTESLVWLENDGKQNFKYHIQERGTLNRLTVTTGDFDGDGDIDIAAGQCLFTWKPPAMPPFDIYDNRLIKK